MVPWTKSIFIEEEKDIARVRWQRRMMTTKKEYSRTYKTSYGWIFCYEVTFWLVLNNIL